MLDSHSVLSVRSHTFPNTEPPELGHRVPDPLAPQGPSSLNRPPCTSVNGFRPALPLRLVLPVSEDLVHPRAPCPVSGE